MAERPTFENFGTPEALLKVIQERSDDIEKAVICPPGFGLTFQGRPTTAPMPFFVMVFYFMSGERKLVHQDAAEMVLNDGILSRMKIKIEFVKGAA